MQSTNEYFAQTEQLKKALNNADACINYGETFCPPQIQKQSICIDQDIETVLKSIT